jgi:adenosylhomocysteine nucleosidase
VAPPAFVVSAGVCGALSPDLAEGDLVVPETVVSSTGARYATAAVAGLRRAGTLVTVDEVVATPSAKARLWVEAGALACDMESAAILEWARARRIPAAVIRAVSDTAEHGVPADLAAVVEPDGRVRTLRAVRTMLARPRAFADALLLRSGTHAALRTVARALGRAVRERVD